MILSMLCYMFIIRTSTASRDINSFAEKNLIESTFRSTKGTDRHGERRPNLCCYPKGP